METSTCERCGERRTARALRSYHDSLYCLDCWRRAAYEDHPDTVMGLTDGQVVLLALITILALASAVFGVVTLLG